MHANVIYFRHCICHTFSSNRSNTYFWSMIHSALLSSPLPITELPTFLTAAKRRSLTKTVRSIGSSNKYLEVALVTDEITSEKYGESKIATIMLIIGNIVRQSLVFNYNLSLTVLTATGLYLSILNSCKNKWKYHFIIPHFCFTCAGCRHFPRSQYRRNKSYPRHQTYYGFECNGSKYNVLPHWTVLIWLTIFHALACVYRYSHS